MSARAVGLTGAGGLVTKLTHTVPQEASVPHHVSLSVKLPECLHNMAAGLPQSEQSKKENKKEATRLPLTYSQRDALSFLPHATHEK